MTERLMDFNGVPDKYWSHAIKHAVAIHNQTSYKSTNNKTPWELVKGDTPNISPFWNFDFYQKVRYIHPDNKFPNVTVLPGRFLGIEWDTGDLLTYRILPDTTDPGEPTVLTRSVVEPDNGSNLRTNKLSSLSSTEYGIQNIRKWKGTRKNKKRKAKNKNKSNEDIPLTDTEPENIPDVNPIDTSDYICPFDDPEPNYNQ